MLDITDFPESEIACTGESALADFGTASDRKTRAEIQFRRNTLNFSGGVEDPFLVVSTMTCPSENNPFVQFVALVNVDDQSWFTHTDDLCTVVEFPLLIPATVMIEKDDFGSWQTDVGSEIEAQVCALQKEGKSAIALYDWCGRSNHSGRRGRSLLRLWDLFRLDSIRHASEDDVDRQRQGDVVIGIA